MALLIKPVQLKVAFKKESHSGNRHNNSTRRVAYLLGLCYLTNGHYILMQHPTIQRRLASAAAILLLGVLLNK